MLHPAIDGQLENTLQALEDMLQACVLDFRKAPDDHEQLMLIEFSYNNNNRSNIEMSPFEVFMAGDIELSCASKR